VDGRERREGKENVIKNHDPEQIEQFIERYLRHEMTPDEEQQWEEHYFSCDHCFRLLEQTSEVARFVRGVAPAESVVDAPEAEKGRRSLLGSFLEPFLNPATLRPALATVLVLVVVGIVAIMGWMKVGTLQNRLDNLGRPAIPLASYSLRGPYRGPDDLDAPAGPDVQLRKDDEGFLLRVPALTMTEPSSVYRANIEGPAGTTVWTSGKLKIEPATRSFRIFCQGAFFEPGRHNLHIEVVRPSDGEVMQTLSFPFRIVEASE
jgi:hypothetical protein